MRWELSSHVDLSSPRISAVDAERQMATAAEICRRLDDQFGVVLADEVGMGKTFVALAVAASVSLADPHRRPVVVMVPPSVRSKWPTEWKVFQSLCLRGNPPLRATDETVTNGADFLKLLDDDARTRKHIVFMTHGALTNSLKDPFVRLAIVRHAFRYQRSLERQRHRMAKWAARLLGDRRFDEWTVDRLLNEPESRWRSIWRVEKGSDVGDNPVPAAVLRALKVTDLTDLRDCLGTLPLKESKYLDDRLSAVRADLKHALESVWRVALSALDEHLPLVILDEAHHLKNPNQLAGLFSSKEAQEDADALQGGALGDVFERMLFLTATPFQLGHAELVNVLGRFRGVRAPTSAKDEFDEELAALKRALDHAQAAAIRLERVWGRMTVADLERASAEWWTEDPPAGEHLAAIAAQIRETQHRNVEAAELLRKWVIRHSKGGDADDRRRHRCGQQMLDDEGAKRAGLVVTGRPLLPFLLAARAQAVVSLKGLQEDRAVRAYFAEGIASSFEAYADTRRERLNALEEDATITDSSDSLPPEVAWHIDQIEALLPSTAGDMWDQHPKVNATTERVRRLWLTGEKVLVFCFYRATGRALRAHISKALKREIICSGRSMLGTPDLSDDEVMAQLELLSHRLLRRGSRGARLVQQRVGRIANAAALDDDTTAEIVDVVLRFMRTPSFLVRYLELGDVPEQEALARTFDHTDESKASLADKLTAFTHHLATRTNDEAMLLRDALNRLQTGGIRVDTPDFFDEGEASTRSDVVLPNVRLANGEVRAETRQRLMLGFNTPFFPEVLVASSVMAEGVDLHLDCRHVIHHDLDWNPSVLEQRTGRLDRLNSKAERAHLPIVVDEPYIEGAQDEKMFKVVKDRERWFHVLMGEKIRLDEWSTDRAAERVPLPDALAEALSFDLGIPKPER